MLSFQQPIVAQITQRRQDTEGKVKKSIMNAIKQGLLTPTTKSRLNELQKHLLDVNTRNIPSKKNQTFLGFKSLIVRQMRQC